MVKIRKDLTNQKFNRLTVIKRAEDYIKPDGRHEAQWYCKCDCGNEIIVRSYCLTSNHTKSCGCLQKETASECQKKYNTYNLSGEYGVGYTSKGEKFYFDLEDYDIIKDYCWCIDQYGYVRGNTKTSKIKMHRLITGCIEGMVVDHINHNKTDNRKTNLRICTQQKNNMNRSIVSQNTSGVTGVFWNKNNDKWGANIGLNGKTIYLGIYDNFEDAVEARMKAEKKYFGEYSYNNSKQIKDIV